MKRVEEAQRMKRAEEARGVKWTGPVGMLSSKD